MQEAYDFLCLLNQNFPPPDGAGAHSLTLDFSGNETRLRLTLAGYVSANGSLRASLLFDRGDFENNSPEELVQQVVNIARIVGMRQAIPGEPPPDLPRFPEPT